MLAERCLPLLACVAALAGVAWPRPRRNLTWFAAGLLMVAIGLLGWHLLTDHFAYRYVWLYSGAARWHLKLANLWGGDEGTLLFLAMLLALSAARLITYRGWAGPCALSLTAVFALAAAIWSPFTPTAPEALARAASQGMNVHLLRIWMVIHPPLIFTAYVFILAPTGAALEALVKGTGEWRLIAQRWGRMGWLILSAGLAAGMWAYEDFTFGQFWHWDPVQTSVFIVWALATAYQHGCAAIQPEGLFARVLPGLALLAAVAALTSMAVTRNAVLAEFAPLHR
ncbi:MAG: cytochrome c biogenesis protein CcsA [Gammaproteobacteria bacterium]